ncbi:MAG: hypothetical protein WBQ36_12875 [Desulfobaccales bacterium]
MSLPEKTHFPRFFGLSAPFQQNLPGQAAFAEFQRLLQAAAKKNKSLEKFFLTVVQEAWYQGNTSSRGGQENRTGRFGGPIIQ